MRKRIFLIITLLIFQWSFGQENYTEIQSKLDELSKVQTGLNDKIQINVSQLSLFDFINSISVEHNLNVSADDQLTELVYNNFFDVSVKEVFIFLAKKYDLKISFIGNIISISKNKKVEAPKKTFKRKIPIVTYDPQNDFLTLKLQNDTLQYVAKEITEKSGRNVVVSPEIKNDRVTVYSKNQPFDQIIKMLTKGNDLNYTKEKEGYYYIFKTPKETVNSSNSRKNRPKNQRKINTNFIENYEYSLEILADDLLTIQAHDTPVLQIIKDAATKTKTNYFFYSLIDANLKTTFSMKNITFQELLTHLLIGTKYTYKYNGDYYLIGEKKEEGIRKTELVQVENRTLESVLQTIPQSIKKELTIVEFKELNGLMVTGAESNIEELKAVVRKIDQTVPLVQIEVLIVQYKKSYDFETGLQAGIGKKPDAPQTVFPNPDVSLNSKNVNNLIDAFNGFGIFNIGKVTKDFYLNLKALENNSIVNIKSTPKIATLSGHEASLSIGSTDYYFQQNNRLITQGVNNNILQSGDWKPTEANMTVTINPTVSKGEYVTLDITVEKSAFTGRSGKDAPPGKTTQKFQSLVRVNNSDMVLLGGLDEVEKENSGTGVPFLSRIPIIKWFFSSRKKAKSKSKLHVFIRPIIQYQ
ncbi:FecR domain-containing protein [Aureivirga marina]|uniref:FecR domain-containing protein n=1 Tax=Aureivirga marina TaxID=1182451 RepID=UPI0018CBE3AF|nr:FecR domain-containing protein [Aureivirga marina]